MDSLLFVTFSFHIPQIALPGSTVAIMGWTYQFYRPTDDLRTGPNRPMDFTDQHFLTSYDAIYIIVKNIIHLTNYYSCIYTIASYSKLPADYSFGRSTKILSFYVDSEVILLGKPMMQLGLAGISMFQYCHGSHHSSLLTQAKTLWYRGIVVTVLSQEFLKNCPRIKIFRKFSSYRIKYFVLGHKFSKNFCPRTEKFCPTQIKFVLPHIG